jgi:ADP-heptose:LPS heptosyltransferase
MQNHQNSISKSLAQFYKTQERLGTLKPLNNRQIFTRRISRIYSKIFARIAYCIFYRPPKRKLLPREVRRVLILRWDLLGDMIVTTSVFNFLKEINPNVEIHILASSKNAVLVQDDSRLSKIFTYQEDWSIWKEIFEARKYKYDLSITFVDSRSTKDALLVNLFAPNSIKASVKRRYKYRPFFSTFSNIAEGQTHMAEKFLDIVRSAVQAPLLPIRLSLEIPESLRSKSSEFIKDKRLDKFVIVNISAGASYREWGEENFINLLKKLCLKYKNLNFVLLTAANNQEKVLRIYDAFASAQILAYPYTSDIREVAGLIERAAMVISSDTSIIHLASATQRPTLGLYTIINTLPVEWFPFNVPYRIVLAQGLKPVSTISVESAAKAFDELYEEINFNAKSD